jgi:hypothetical protein
MKRIDIMGLCGVGKTTIFRLLGQYRKDPCDFQLFEEAYQSLGLKKSSALAGFLFKQIKRTESSVSTIKKVYQFPLKKLLNFQIRLKTRTMEQKNLHSALQELMEKYPNFTQTILNLPQNQFGLDSFHVSLNESISVKKTLKRINQYSILQKYLDDDIKIIFDYSFLMKIFTLTDFSQPINAEKIHQYIKSMPKPFGTINLIAPPEVIIARLRGRAKLGRVNEWHRNIIDSDLLEQWVENACEISRIAMSCMAEEGASLYNLNAEDEPAIVASRARDYICSF